MARRYLPQFRRRFGALFFRRRTEGVKPAARRRFHGTGDFPLQDGPLPGPGKVRVRDGNRLQQGLGIGMKGVFVKLVAFRQFHQAPQVHHGDPPGNMAHHRYVVGDKQVGQAQFRLHILQHIHNLGLNRYVQGGNRLVADDKFRLHRQGPGDTDPLLLSPGKFVGIPVGVFAVQPHPFQKAPDPILPFFPGDRQFMNIQGFPDNFPHGHPGVQGRRGVLEDDLHLPPEGQHIRMGDVFSLKKDLPPGRFVEPQDGPPQGGLSAARFPHEPQGFSLPDVQGHGLNGVDIFYLPPTFLDPEVFLEIFQMYQGDIIHHRPPPFFWERPRFRRRRNRGTRPAANSRPGGSRR